MPILKYAFAFMMLCPAAALADRIDGSWCNSAGGHVEIDGPKITLADKSVIDGTYARHEFLYTTPAGAQIYLRLLDEDDMMSFTLKDKTPADGVAWKRCAATN